MPFVIEQISPRRYRVVNTDSGKVHAKRTTEQKARRQIFLLRRYEVRMRVNRGALGMGLERRFLDTWWFLSPGTYQQFFRRYRGVGESMMRNLLVHDIRLFNSIAVRLQV